MGPCADYGMGIFKLAGGMCQCLNSNRKIQHDEKFCYDKGGEAMNGFDDVKGNSLQIIV